MTRIGEPWTAGVAANGGNGHPGATYSKQKGGCAAGVGEDADEA